MSLSVFLYIFTEIYISAMFSVNLNIIEYMYHKAKNKNVYIIKLSIRLSI